MIQMTLKTEFKINKKVVWMMGFITCIKEKAKRERWTLIHSTAKAILIKKTIIDRLWHQAIIWLIKLSTRIKFTLRVLMELILICLGLRFRIKFIILTSLLKILSFLSICRIMFSLFNNKKLMKTFWITFIIDSFNYYKWIKMPQSTKF
jgi:hypothetical protein